uniref:RNase III domain-containing protein n=1 Tax=Oryza glumipatula TaxID=40148 RepID=A0A0D9YAE0_9ORYZ
MKECAREGGGELGCGRRSSGVGSSSRADPPQPDHREGSTDLNAVDHAARPPPLRPRFTKSVEGPYSGDPIEGPRVLADIVEAIVGAVYLDSKLDLEVLQKVAKLLCEPIITKKALLEDPESMLNELGGEHREDLEIKILAWRKVANVVDDGREQAITTSGLGNGSEDEAT